MNTVPYADRAEVYTSDIPKWDVGFSWVAKFDPPNPPIAAMTWLHQQPVRRFGSKAAADILAATCPPEFKPWLFVDEIYPTGKM